MKVTYLVPGSGGSFYCENCYRDMIYVSSLKKIGGIDISAIPLYLPPIAEEFGEEIENQVFFGAVSMYLREKVKIFENMPSFLDKIFDAPPFLRMAAKKAGTTRTEGFEETTISMIKGNDPSRDKEIARLSKHICASGQSNILHLSNALIIGLASQLRNLCNASIICSLQNEDDWIDQMKEPYRSEAWKLIGEESSNVDLFITPSHYFKEFIISKTGIQADKIHVVPSVLDERNPVVKDTRNSIPAIGYFSRLSYHNGLDKLVDAFILLKNEEKMPGLQLHLCGGYTGNDKSFIKEQFRKIKENDLDSVVKIYSTFSGKQKEEFFNAIDVMSVPVRKHDAYGLYILEANSAGVPVVQPATGAFPEIIGRTNGGITYQPDSVEALADALFKLLSDRQKLNELSRLGIDAVFNKMSTGNMAKQILSIYKKAIK